MDVPAFKLSEMYYEFRLAEPADIPEIWEILQQAIGRRSAEGSEQWQDGYPNEQIIAADISSHNGFVIEYEHAVAAYAAIIYNDEPAYEQIEGKWLSVQPFYVVHRLAVAERFLGKGFAKKIFAEVEKLAAAEGVRSIKVDTNFDNKAVLGILENLGYVYCGEVYYRGAPRRAFEKLLEV